MAEGESRSKGVSVEAGDGCPIGTINQLHLLRSHSLLQLGVDGDGDGHDDREWSSIGRHMVRALS